MYNELSQKFITLCSVLLTILLILILPLAGVVNLKQRDPLLRAAGSGQREAVF